MALETKYICDSCGSYVTPEGGVIRDKEFTVEKGQGSKLSIVVTLDDSFCNDPVICKECLKRLIDEWVVTGNNFIRNG